MDQRFSIENREHFSYEDRVLIAKKTDGKCAHCGKLLNLKNEATIEHMIPISKGGSNDISNLTILCKECNFGKKDAVVAPHYFKFLKDEFQEEITNVLKNYIEEVDWFTPRNYLSVDTLYLSCPVDMSSQIHGKKKNRIPTITVVLKKAGYEDLDDINQFVEKYHDKFNLDKSELKDVISSTFTLGAIYILKNTGGITGVIPLCIDIDQGVDGNTPHYIISFKGLPCVYQKPTYGYIMSKALKYLTDDIKDATGSDFVTAHFVYPAEDSFAEYIISSVFGIHVINDNEWNKGIGFQRNENIEAFNNLEKACDADVKFGKSLQRSLRLAPLKKKEERISTVTKNYKTKKVKQEYDEYDPEYYGLRA